MTSWPQEDLEMQVIEIIVIDDAGEAPENMELGEIEADKKQVQFTDLNDYCVVHIFDFLDVSSKVNFRKVCTRWSDLTWKITELSFFLHSFLYKFGNQVTLEDLTQILQKSRSHVENLKIENRWGPMNNTIHTLEIDGEFFQLIANIVSTQKFTNDIVQIPCKLRKLTLNGFHTSQWLNECQQLFYDKKIQSLSLEIEHQEEFVHIFSQSSFFAEFLTELSLLVVRTTDDYLCYLLSLVKNLTSLTFICMTIPNRVMQCVSCYCTELTYLGFDNVGPSWTMETVENISRLQYLRVLDLKDIRKDLDQVLIAIGERCANLTELRLFDCTFSTKGINPLLENENFNSLAMSTCEFISDESPSCQSKLQHLSISCFLTVEDDLNKFLVFRELKTFKCSFTKNLSDKNLQTIAASSAQLTSVELEATGKVTREGISFLASLPNLMSIKLTNFSFLEISTFISSEIKGPKLKHLELRYYNCFYKGPNRSGVIFL